jgi:hypothetical protein
MLSSAFSKSALLVVTPNLETQSLHRGLARPSILSSEEREFFSLKYKRAFLQDRGRHLQIYYPRKWTSVSREDMFLNLFEAIYSLTLVMHVNNSATFYPSVLVPLTQKSWTLQYM